MYQLMQPQVLYDRSVQIYFTVLFNILCALFLNAKLTAPIKTASWKEVIMGSAFFSIKNDPNVMIVVIMMHIFRNQLSEKLLSNMSRILSAVVMNCSHYLLCKKKKNLCISTFFENIHHQQIKCCSYCQFTILHFASSKEYIHIAHKVPIYIDCRSDFQEVCASWFIILQSCFGKRDNWIWIENSSSKTHENVCLCLCVYEQYFARCRLSLSHAGTDRSSRLWEERAGPQTVSGVQRILCIWVCLNVSVDIECKHCFHRHIILNHKILKIKSENKLLLLRHYKIMYQISKYIQF